MSPEDRIPEQRVSEFAYQHEGKAVETDGRFSHVMAIALDPRSGYTDGIIRCITSRSGDVAVKGYTDRSEIHRVSGSSLEQFKIGDRIRMRNEAEVISRLTENGADFLGIEDPDIWIDDSAGLVHVYFTLPFIRATEHKTKIHLGHAVGPDLDSLEMTEPVLLADEIGGAKELSVAPVNSKGLRYNLVESSKRESDFNYSVVRTAVAEDMGQPWSFGEIVFHPKEHGIPWIGGHASPGPLFSERFMDLGKGKRLGIMNGREANRIGAEGKTLYGIFSVGLFIYDYENGKIDWVSPEPLIRDSEARTITFASQLVETGPGEGALYAHVDDSFVRAYTLKAEQLRKLF